MADMKLTRNQTIVIAALKDAGRPLTAYQILDRDEVRENGLKAPLTIYRALEKLIDQGMAHRIESLNAFVACPHEAHADPPAFMICNACKRTIEFSSKSVRRTVARQAAGRGFQIKNMHLEVTGVCERCQATA
jgi:Fur family transcriptional regulator, zinc uptake regulator